MGLRVVEAAVGVGAGGEAAVMRAIGHWFVSYSSWAQSGAGCADPEGVVCVAT